MIQEKLQKLADKVQEDHIKYLKVCKLDCDANIANAKTSIVDGKKYAKINIGGSGKLMVEKESEVIYGIKGYGVVHKGHSYGTLDTIESFFWGNFYPQRIK
jgi:hypothetical protein